MKIYICICFDCLDSLSELPVPTLFFVHLRVFYSESSEYYGSNILTFILNFLFHNLEKYINLITDLFIYVFFLGMVFNIHT